MTEHSPAPPLTKNTLRSLAEAQGLALSDAELDGLLPLVQAGRALMAELADAPLGEAEPTVLFHMR